MPLFSTVLSAASLCLMTLLVSLPELQAAPRNAFPGRRVGGGTRGECAARSVVHLVPSSSVFAPGGSSSIAVLEGPSSNPQPLQILLRVASADGGFDPAAVPILQREFPGAQNRLVLLSFLSSQKAMRWESSYQCGPEGGGDEFGFITASAPPALSLLVPGSGDRDDRDLQQLLANLQKSCGGTAALEPLKTALQLGDELINDSWPEHVTVRCF